MLIAKDWSDPNFIETWDYARGQYLVDGTELKVLEDKHLDVIIVK